MFDLIQQLPALLIEHWFIGAIALVLFLSLIYVVVLKTWFAAEKVRDIKRRNRNL
jgi:hypothetical protein